MARARDLDLGHRVGVAVLPGRRLVRGDRRTGEERSARRHVHEDNGTVVGVDVGLHTCSSLLARRWAHQLAVDVVLAIDVVLAADAVVATLRSGGQADGPFATSARNSSLLLNVLSRSMSSSRPAAAPPSPSLRRPD